MIIRNTICRPFSVEIKNIRYVIQQYLTFEVRAWHKYFQGNYVYTEMIKIHNELLVVPYPCHRCIVILSCVEYMILYILYDYIGHDGSVGYKYSWRPFLEGHSFIWTCHVYLQWPLFMWFPRAFKHAFSCRSISGKTIITFSKKIHFARKGLTFGIHLILLQMKLYSQIHSLYLMLMKWCYALKYYMYTEVVNIRRMENVYMSMLYH